MAWMETDYSKHTYFRWKVKWRLEHLGALGIMGGAAPLMYHKSCIRWIVLHQYVVMFVQSNGAVFAASFD